MESFKLTYKRGKNHGLHGWALIKGADGAIYANGVELQSPASRSARWVTDHQHDRTPTGFHKHRDRDGERALTWWSLQSTKSLDMYKRAIYSMATLLVAIAAFLFLPKSSEDDPGSKDNPASVVKGKSDGEDIIFEKISRNGLASTSVTETSEVIDLSDKVKVVQGRPPRWEVYVDEEMADKLGLDRHKKAEVERIVDYYKNEMEQINLDNATVTAVNENKYVIEIANAGERGREVASRLLKEISITIGEEKLKGFIMHENRVLSEYFNSFGQSARRLEIEVKTDTFYKNSGEVKFSWDVAYIKDTFIDFGFSSGSRLPMSRLGNYAAIETLIDRSESEEN